MSTPDEFFLYVCATDAAARPDAREAFDRAHRWWAIEMDMAYFKDLDRYGQCPVDDEKPNHEDYIRGTIASRTDFITVADAPLTLTAAQNLAAQLRTEHPIVATSRDLAGAIPVRGDIVCHHVDIPIPERGLTEGFRAWLDHAAANAVAAAYPSEALEEIGFYYQHQDDGIEQVRADLYTRGTPDQHTGWAFFA
ncbi:hypothetical protein [Nocardia amamiensis]|uniref:hypothetical protein n=1 Tax=Nocardia amamiensis TaxID=404578 RepID=UPI000837A232|nr:hypothetical protein [Nocardia amamiensis]